LASVMCVCMYACMYACMHACMYVCMYVCMHACVGVCIYTHTVNTSNIYVCVFMESRNIAEASAPATHICIRSRIHAYAHIRMHTHVCAGASAGVRARKYVAAICFTSVHALHRHAGKTHTHTHTPAAVTSVGRRGSALGGETCRAEGHGDDSFAETHGWLVCAQHHAAGSHRASAAARGNV